MTLCARLGYPHPDYLLPWLSSSQLNDWISFHQGHNLSIDRDDSFWSVFLAMYHNVHADKRKYPTDFIPWHTPDTPELSVDDLRRKLGFS